MEHEKVIIAIIDDGVNTAAYASGPLIHDMEITEELCVRPREAADPTMPSRATSCGAVIRKYAPDAPLSSIKIVRTAEGQRLKEQLIKAIEWCTGQGIRLLQINPGSAHYRDSAGMSEAVNAAYRSGIVIVSPGDSRGLATYPASLSGVIGVKCDPMRMVREDEYIYNYGSFSGIDITACGSQTITRGGGEKWMLSPSESMAASLITARIYNIMKKLPQLTPEEVQKRLIEEASNRDCPINTYLCRGIDKAEKALVFELGESMGDRVLPGHSFEILAWHNIAAGSLHEAESGMKDFFIQNRLIKEADTIVIINNIPGKQSGWDIKEFAGNVGRLGKGMIYINGEPNVAEAAESTCTESLRTSACYKFNTDTGADSSVQMPVILLCDYAEGLLEEILYELNSAFREDGYHSIAALDYPLEDKRGFGFLHLPEEDAGSGLETLALIYDPDIILLGIAAAERGNKTPKAVMSSGADILIELMRGAEYAESKPGEDIYFQVSVMGREGYQIRKLFFYTEGVPVGELYSYIGYLFREYAGN